MIGLDEIEARVHGRAVGDDSCFWTRAGRGYRDGLARMAELVVDDPFLRGTNAKVTEYKLEPYCAMLLDRDPHDVRALWSQIGSDVRLCSNELEERCWRTLLDMGDFRPHWLVEHGYWVFAVSGADTASLLADALRRHRLVEVIRSAVLGGLRTEDPYSRWVASVLVASV